MLNHFADLHCDTLWRCFEERRSLFHPTLQVRAHHSFSLLQNYAIYIPDSVEDPLEYFRCVYDYGRMLFDEMPNYCFCKKFGDIEQAIAQGRRPCMISIEGGCFFSGKRDLDLLRIEEFKEKGIAFISLCYNNGNHLAGGIFCPDQELSEAGKNSVLMLHESGISVDISHLNRRSADQVLALLPDGVVATHSNCNSIMPHPRNLSDEQIRAIARKNGLIGLNFYPPFLKNGSAGSDDLLNHIDHLIELGADRAIAFGGDFDGIDLTLPDLSSTDDLEILYDKLNLKFKEKAMDFCFQNVMNYLKRYFR